MKLSRTFQIRLDLFAVLPLINVLFLALVLFSLSSRFTLQPGLNVHLPSSSFSLAPAVKPLLITITAAPTPTVYLGEEKVSSEKLESILQDSQLAGRQVIIRADGNSPYEWVTQIANLALKHKFPVSLAFSPKSSR